MTLNFRLMKWLNYLRQIWCFLDLIIVELLGSTRSHLGHFRITSSTCSTHNTPIIKLHPKLSSKPTRLQQPLYYGTKKLKKKLPINLKKTTSHRQMCVTFKFINRLLLTKFLRTFHFYLGHGVYLYYGNQICVQKFKNFSFSMILDVVTRVSMSNFWLC